MLRNAGQYDSGGWLPVGYSLAYNGTGAPERVGGPVLTIDASGWQFGAGADTDTIRAEMRAGFKRLEDAVVRRVGR